MNAGTLAEIGQAAVDAEMVFVDQTGRPYWWCRCGDAVTLDDVWWMKAGMCGQCASARGFGLDE